MRSWSCLVNNCAVTPILAQSSSQNKLFTLRLGALFTQTPQPISANERPVLRRSDQSEASIDFYCPICVNSSQTPALSLYSRQLSDNNTVWCQPGPGVSLAQCWSFLAVLNINSRRNPNVRDGIHTQIVTFEFRKCRSFSLLLRSLQKKLNETFTAGTRTLYIASILNTVGSWRKGQKRAEKGRNGQKRVKISPGLTSTRLTA